MRFTAKFPRADIGRFKCLADYRRFEKHFKTTLETGQDTLETFRSLDNTKHDGHKEDGIVTLSGANGYTGTLTEKGQKVSLDCVLRNHRGRKSISYQETAGQKSLDVNQERLIEDKTTGLISAFTERPLGFEPEVQKTWLQSVAEFVDSFRPNKEQLEAPVPEKGLEKKLHKIFDGKYSVLGSYRSDEVGRMDDPKQLELLQIRQEIDQNLMTARQLFLEFDQSTYDRNHDKGDIVMDRIKRSEKFSSHPAFGAEYYIGDGHSLRDSSSGTLIDGHFSAGGMTRQRDGRILQMKSENEAEDEALGRLGDLAYIENFESGEIRVFQSLK